MALHSSKKVSWTLALLALLQVDCLAESDPGTESNCGPRDLTPECCIKRFPGQWERCTGAPEAEQVVRSPSPAMKLAAVSTATIVAVTMQPRINAAEHRGVELAADLLAKVERAIERCTRKADQQVNDHHFQGRSPSAEICQQLKAGDQVTWAVYLGLFKHEQAWPCLHKELDQLLPGRYWLQPRFRLDDRTGQWEFLDKKRVEEIVAKQGWKGLTGTIEPDLILLDGQGVIVSVYDLKFPCPDSNIARWERYSRGPWRDWFQGELYKAALQVTPRLVSPRQGVIRK
ncbi:putative lipoprotein [Cystobacter fuscus DSM 2262]|uniref:Lipoprotein n=1 Tax=Cystobacter fuscus (strain ATCC 25194 / DSM 2262 / NBRC 100088 / M29) TaxID=1242864 RepID=S9PCB4_CYSF2|nr:hypothetical protein [Cystobacter fuscus]EPX59927.1 putative lipoprotein [Cystobacter fuscus DSM 2262]